MSYDFRHLQLLAKPIAFEAGDEFVSPAKLSDDEKRALLEGIEQKRVLSLRFRAAVYADAPNLNSWRINPGHLAAAVAAIEASELPRQLELDHGWSTRARVGNLSRGYLETDEAGVRWLVAECELVEPQAMADFVRGRLDRFSIGMGPTREVECSTCGAKWAADRWGWLAPTCKHTPGEDGCEAFVVADIEEASFVLHPAVPGTRVLSRQGAQTMPHAKQAAEAVTTTEPTEESAEHRALAEERAERTKLETQLAELQAQKAAADAERAKLASQVREHALESWVREGRIFPAELEHYREIWEAMGEEKTKALVAKRTVNVLGHASQTACAEPEQLVKPSASDKLSRVNQAYRLGLISKPMTEADINRLGCY